MHPDKLIVILVLCMTVPWVSGCAKERAKPVTAEIAPPIQQEKKSIAEEKPISTETASPQNKAPDPDEPTVLELQRAAIRYAEVNPDKITNWRHQAAVKSR